MRRHRAAVDGGKQHPPAARHGRAPAGHRHGELARGRGSRGRDRAPSSRGRPRRWIASACAHGPCTSSTAPRSRRRAARRETSPSDRPPARAHGDHRKHLGDRRRHRQPARTGIGDQHEPGQIDPQPLGRLGAELRHADHAAPRSRLRRRGEQCEQKRRRRGDRVRGARPKAAARQQRGEGGKRPAARGRRVAAPACGRPERAGGAHHPWGIGMHLALHSRPHSHRLEQMF